jgi:hypothetical protein
MHNNNSTVNAYADIRPTEHNLKDLSQIMSVRNKSELSTLRAVNDLASMPYGDVVKTQKRWQAVKNGALIVSLMLLVITMILLYTSPIINQNIYSLRDIRAWGLGAYLAVAALISAFVFDIGRSFILDKSNNDSIAWGLYIFFMLLSISFSTVGMLAVATFYASSNQSETSKSIDTARQYMIDHASMANVTMASLDSQQAAFDKKFYTKGTGYKRRAHLRDTARIEAERAELKKYLSAKATVDGKQDLLANTDSSNWLYNTFATITGSTVALAGIMLGILVNLIAEFMGMVAHSRLIKLNARLEITNSRWNLALMALDRAVIVNSSTLQLIAGIDTFQHVFSMPSTLLSRYHEAHVSVGDFAQTERQVQSPDIEIIEQDKKLITNDSSVERMRELYRASQNAKKGDIVLCPTCEKRMMKTGIKIFCSNSKNKRSDGGNCSDEYHNAINPDRLRHAR